MAANAVVTQFTFGVIGRSRDETIAAADDVANAILAELGGEPWLMVDDDWDRNHVSDSKQPLLLADDQGFFYTGKRRYVFNGPHVGGAEFPMHEGHNIQKRIRDE